MCDEFWRRPSVQDAHVTRCDRGVGRPSNRYSARAASTVLLSLLSIASCAESSGAGSAEPGAGATLILLDSIVLAETDGAVVGKPADLIAAPDGRFFISDLFARRVLVFGRDGRFLQGIGRAGDGPGELESPSMLALSGDSILYVLDDQRVRVEMFDAKSGAWREGREFPGRVSGLDARNQRLLAGYLDTLRQTSVAVVANDSDSLWTTGPLPALFERSVMTHGVFGTVQPLGFHDTVATAYEVSNHIYLSRVGGGVLDSLLLPAVRRHGARTDLLSRITDDPRTLEQAVYKSSMPYELARLPSGALALVSLDYQWIDNRPQGTNYLSLVDLERRRSCPDAVIPGPVDPVPRVALRGDTLFVLVQDVDAAGRAYSTIRAYAVDSSSCGWMPADAEAH
ncbi:MAG TPA: 6-bladed beta-propeller [Longimicrobiales bacterium]